MANIIVSADTFLDTATGTRAAADAISFGAASTFTIRTDTRWYQGAPAGMTGTLGSISAFRGAKVFIDGTKVRLVPFSGGTGNVPAINTTVTQGGVTGTLLAVYANLTSAPSAVGSAMPATGFLKFREVAGGAFAPGALTGIGATASGAETAGWIEVVTEPSASWSAGPNGEGIVAQGAWFDLGVTTGTPGQLLQAPTNGGGTNTFINGVQIETAPGSGVFEWYPSITTDRFTTALLSTDVRSKVVQFVSNGQMRIGSDGTTNIGFTPPAGCAIRIPNIFFRSVAAAARATNVVPGGVTRATLNIASGAKMNLDKVHLEMNVTPSVAKSISLTNSIAEFNYTFTDSRDINLSGSCFSQYISTLAYRVYFTRCTNIKLDNVKCLNKYATSYSGILGCTGTQNISGTNVELVQMGAQSAGNFGLNMALTNNVNFTRLRLKNGNVHMSAKLSNVTLKDVDYCENVVGTTSTTGASNLFNMDTSNNIMIDGFTTGEYGAVPNTHWYGTFINLGTYGSNNVTVRNIGTPTQPLDVGTNATVYPNSLISVSALSLNFKAQRIYISATRAAAGATIFGNMPYPYLDNAIIESVYMGTASNNTGTDTALSNVLRKGLYVTGTQTTGLSVTTGSVWADYFAPSPAATTGSISWMGNTPSTGTDYIVSESPYSGYLGTGVALGNVGDTAYSEISYYVKGHTGFRNVAPTINGVATTNYLIEYQLDTGNGYGTWKTLNAANLSAETISPTGFKIKYRFTLIATTSSTVATSYIGAIHIQTDTTPEARAANLYPLDQVTLSFEGLVPGSEIRAYEGTNPATAVEIGGIESVGGTTWSFTHSSSGKEGYIMIFAMGYQPIMIPRTYGFEDTSLLIQQVIDRNYLNP